ncbi:MAG: 30S ribosomal protein S1 [Elusimicrobiota bacterium]
MDDDKILVVEESDVNIEELLNASDSNKREEREIVNGKVVEINNKSIAVDVGLKSEGVISKEEIGSDIIKIGDVIPVFLEALEGVEGHPVVSYRKAKRISNWNKLDEVFKDAGDIDGKVIRKVKGGYIVDIGGESTFLPLSQTILKRNESNTVNLVDQTVTVKIIELDRRRRNIVVSQRKVKEDENNRKKAELYATISEGSIIKGRVTSITSFGAFVDIGGVEGLLHISDIAWSRIEKVEDIISMNQELELKIVKFDPANDKISLSLKELKAHPWEDISTKFPNGKMVKGKVTSLLPFGAFIELEPGVEGLLHISEISWTEKIRHPQDILKTGDEVEVRILDVIPEKEKISLSLKRIGENPWEAIKQKYPSGTKVKGIVTNLVPFGAFVKLDEGVEGLIHISDFSWTKKIRHPQEILNLDQEVEAVVLEVNPEQEKVVLGLKQLNDNPYTKYQLGATIEAKVKKITEYAVFVELENDIEGIIKISDLSLNKVKDAKEVLNEGQWIKAKVLRVDLEEHKIMLSVKKYEKERETEDIKKYMNRDEDKVTLGDVIKLSSDTLLNDKPKSESNDESA